MTQIEFVFNGNHSIIQCNKEEKVENICKRLSFVMSKSINSFIFIHDGEILNLDKELNELTKEDKVYISVYEICSSCGKILNNELIDDLLNVKSFIKESFMRLKDQINNLINGEIKDINYLNESLKNINIIINNIEDSYNKTNTQLNLIKYNQNKDKELKNESAKINEIVCIYNKLEDEIKLLHDYSKINNWSGDMNKSYMEAKININEKNVEIYINDKKIPFNYNYKTNERGEIKAKYIFKNPLTSLMCMFYECISLKLIDFSLFNSSNINDMNHLFYGCSSLKTVNFNSFNTKKVSNMSSLFQICTSLESLDLSSFNTINLNNMYRMFCGCSSLKSINLTSFNTNKVKDMSFLFAHCTSLTSLDLSSFNTTNIHTFGMSDMFFNCSSLKKDRIKISNSGCNILYFIK